MKKSLVPLLLAQVLAACGGTGSYAERETFAGDTRHRRDFAVAAPALCDAARRAMLGEGYVVTRAADGQLIAGKEYPLDDNRHAILNFYVNCEPRAGGSTLFATATEERFDLKASRQSSSLGFPMLAPLYFGTRTESDHQVKISGETVNVEAFYERFYRAVAREIAAP